ncbi:MAG: hypothetical protein U0223_16850 [Nitrospira sp.]|nr:hypothetical protein [Nitrospira sp.]
MTPAMLNLTPAQLKTIDTLMERPPHPAGRQPKGVNLSMLAFPSGRFYLADARDGSLLWGHC